MKIGFSFGRCVRDIVTGVVPFDDVLVIVARTKMHNEEDVADVVAMYMGEPTYLRGLDYEECVAVAKLLYSGGKIHQPRVVGSYRRAVAEEYVWMDVVPTVADMSPTVREAWENYTMLMKLTTDQMPKGDLTSDDIFPI